MIDNEDKIIDINNHVYPHGTQSWRVPEQDLTC